MFDETLQDARFAFRQLRSRPGFTATVMLMLALGFGASAAIFAFVDAALIRPLPYPDPQQLVWTTETVERMGPANLSWQDYQDWQRSARSFSSFAVWRYAGYLLQNGDGIVASPAIRVSANFLQTLRLAPALGRDFQPADNLPGAGKVAMLTYGVWQQQYGGDAELVGKTIRLDGEPHEVIGILPQGFQFAPRGRLQILTALRPDAGGCEARRTCHSLRGVARLKDGVSVAQADQEVKSIAARLEKLYPASNLGQGGMAMPLAEEVVGELRPTLYTLLGGAVLLFAIGSLNVASLLLGRSEHRSREIALRGALGATRARLVRQFVVESFTLVLAGATGGLLSAMSIVRLLFVLIPKDMRDRMPFLAEVRLSRNTLLFVAAEVLLVAFVFACVPLLRLSFSKLQSSLVDGSNGSGSLSWRRVGSQIVVLEVATAVVLLVSAGLLSRSLFRMLHVDMGFRTDHLATLRVTTPSAVFKTDADKLAIQQQVAERFRRIPGVTSVAFGQQLPAVYNGNTDWIRFVGKPYNGKHNEVNQRTASPAYFDTLGVKMLQGRAFTGDDTLGKQRLVIINRKLAEQYYPGEDPLGKQFGDTDLSPASLRLIVGVVENLHEGAPDDDVWPAEYEPAYQQVDSGTEYAVRVAGAEAAMLPQLVTAVHSVSRDLGVSDEVTMDDMIHDSQSSTVHRAAAWLVGAFALTALVLCAIGLYGVVMYSVSLRTREIGIRMALGSPRMTIYQLILREATLLSMAGVITGLLLAVGTAKVLRSMLFQVSAYDPATLAGVALLVLFCSLAAGLLPAHRAATLDPMDSLRTE
ncbi:ABC transporter permease [Terriglobus sp.]|uniref:ABC transporter permease n=1 Tax=Terriglobus sp. TaxID=1889013 RepID=UPI003B00D8A9